MNIVSICAIEIMTKQVKSRCRRFRDHAELSLISFPQEILIVATLLVVALPMVLRGEATPLSVLGMFPAWFQMVWSWSAVILSGVAIFAMHTRRTLIVAGCSAVIGTMYLAHLIAVGMLAVKAPAAWYFPVTWYLTVVVMCWWRASILARQASHAKVAGIAPGDSP